MKTNLNLETQGVILLSKTEMKEMNGGFLKFVAGAIVGGIIYDVWKEGVKGWYKVCTENPDYTDPMYRGR